MSSKKFIFMVLLALSLSASLKVRAQEKFTVDVGNDLHFCGEATELNVQVTIKNGVEPYRYAWEYYLKIGRQTLTASDILNDTTLLSPLIKEHVWSFSEEPEKFILNVTDANGNKAKDSLYLSGTMCLQLLGYVVKEINKGDSVWLDAGVLWGSIERKYWLPAYGLSNPDSSATWCKPEVNTDYYIVSVDTFGCSCAQFSTEIRVNQINYIEVRASGKAVKPYQQGTKVIFSNPERREALVTVFTIEGKLLQQCNVNDDRIELNGVLTKTGLYLVNISLNGKTETCKFLKH